MTHLDYLKEQNIEFPDIGTLNASTVQERYFKLHYPEFRNYVIEHTSQYSWSERLYMIYNNINERPKCPVCGNECTFFNIKTGYGLHCSRKCISKSQLTKTKKEEKCLAKWGVKNPMQSKEIQNKIKQTNLERYGVENVYQSKEIQNKIKQTNLERYGVEYALQSNDVKQKSKNTCLKKYGVEYISQSEEFKNICKQNSIERYGVDHPMKSDIVKQNVRKLHKEKYGVEYITQRPEVIKKVADKLRSNHLDRDNSLIGFTEDYNLIVKCPHQNCNKCNEKYFITPGGIYHDRKRISTEVCTRLLPIKPLISSFELEICKLLDDNNIEYKTNIRSIISNELDIYIPSKNIAIEFNGIYWHSSENKHPKYHINKYNECKEKDIQLITIWEDQYILNRDICNSVILSKLGIYKTKIYARKCELRIVDSRSASNFYSSNHIQGKCGATIHYGLYYNDELVSMMSFGKRKLGKNDITQWELIRYCSKLNTLVIGGSSKLFNYFVKEYSPDTIFSFSSNDISNGNMYKMLKFEKNGKSISYWYIDKQLKRHHRTGFSHKNLIKKGFINENDKRSESEIMKALGYTKIFDSGQTKWIWKSHS